MGAIIAIILSFIGLTLGGVWLAGVLCGAGWLLFVGYLFGRKAVRLEYEARREKMADDLVADWWPKILELAPPLCARGRLDRDANRKIWRI